MALLLLDVYFDTNVFFLLVGQGHGCWVSLQGVTDHWRLRDTGSEAYWVQRCKIFRWVQHFSATLLNKTHIVTQLH